MQYLATPDAIELARSMDIQSGTSLYTIFEGFKHRGMALDASLGSALDGFHPKTREKVIARLLKEADDHHNIMSAFTREDAYLEKFSSLSGGPRSRKLMLWQDIEDNRDNLYAAANAAQQLLSNLGYNRYAPNLLNKSHTLESKQKWSLKNFLKSTVKAGYESHGTGVGTETGVSLTNSKDVSQDTQTTYTDNAAQHTGGWEYAMPYFRVIGENLDLISPQALLSLSSDTAVDAAIAHNTLDETYQRLRGTEVVLLKAINASLPKSLKEDAHLRYLLDNGYVEESLSHLLAKEKIVFNSNESPYQKEKDGELNWAIHSVLYAALYRGARQRIEDIVLRNTAKLIYSLADDGSKELVWQTDRRCSKAMPTTGYTLHTKTKSLPPEYAEPLQRILDYTKHLGLPIHVVEDDEKLKVTGYPELCGNNRNYMDASTAFHMAAYPPLSHQKPTTPLDVVLLKLDGNLGNLHNQQTERLTISMENVLGIADNHSVTKLKL